MAPAPTSKVSHLTAIYTSATSSKTFAHAVPTSGSTQPTPSEKTAQLASLRSSVTKLQDQINTFLTQKMEEDKSTTSGNGAGDSRARGVDEGKEEENYGEEVVNDDD
ncbi:MAG: hypothetical protein M1837_005857 [Sclerophora amabilis]|nr:MAG: hypothetical protein M1837_005857 [Sclerophora amabilis]